MTFDSDVLTLSRRGTVSTLTLERPDRKNALSLELARDLCDAVDYIDETDTRAVLLRGAGGTFSAGGDLEQPPDEFVDEVSASIDAIAKIRDSPIPYVAAVEGAAVGGGLELALACDLRVAGAEAKLGLPEVTVGIFPCAGGTRLLPRLVGAGRAKELLLTGRLVSGELAEDWGLVNRAVDDDAVTATARELAETVGSNSPTGVASALRSTNRTFRETVADGMEWDLELADEVAHHPDFEEGKRAFLENREPTFEDR